jgi:integrase
LHLTLEFTPYPMPKITKRLIENAEVKDKDYIIFDSDIPGFGARILPSGRRSCLVQYRVGRSYRRISLGMHGVLTTDQARGEAIKVLGRVKSGEDPSAARKQARLEMTVSELCERMIEEHAVPHCKPNTVVGYRFYTKAYIKKPIGQIRVSQI